MESRRAMDTGRSASPRHMRWIICVAAFFWQAFMSSCLAVQTVRIIGGGSVPRCAFLPTLQMPLSSSLPLRQGGSSTRSRRQSTGFKMLSAPLSSLASTPFPATTVAASSAKPKRRTHHQHYNATSWSSDIMNDEYREEEEPSPSSFTHQSPFPTMPSPLFINLAQSQFELLSNSLVHTTDTDDETGKANKSSSIKAGTPKISSMVLYLPKENQNTGRLEFVPAVTYPNQASERVFIASDSSNSGIHQPPTVPSMGVLGLPGFFPAKSLIPSYPFVSSSSEVVNNEGTNGGVAAEHEMFTTVSPDSPISVSVVEEIALPNASSSSSGGPTSLSVSLFSGLDTLAVFSIWPYKSSSSSSGSDSEYNQWNWTPSDKLQVTRAAKSLALALSMDNERASTQLANEQFHVAMSDSLHQVKSPLQALRTFGKLLQRQLAEENADGRKGPVMERIPMTARGQQQALKLAEDMMSQGERVIDLIEPMDALVQNGGRYLLRGDIKEPPPPSSSSALLLQPSNSSGRNEQKRQQQQYQLPPSSPIMGDFELEMAFPQDILGSIVYASQAVSREKGIDFRAAGFEPDELPGVTICPKHLQEAVSNLLDNAMKYAPCRRKGRGRPRIPRIKVTLVSNEPPLTPGATLYIEDNGPGIPTSEQDKVFERGYRSKTVQDEVDGSGLGLGICREMIEKMGGTIDLLDEGPNKLDGTTVRIILFRDAES